VHFAKQFAFRIGEQTSDKVLISVSSAELLCFIPYRRLDGSSSGILCSRTLKRHGSRYLSLGM
jgi:hypothetical protein